jgi:hypothetical protein
MFNISNSNKNKDEKEEIKTEDSINENSDNININQIKDSKDQKLPQNEKNKDLGFLGKIRSAVDDIGDGLSKAKDTAQNLLKDNQEDNSLIRKEIKEKIISTRIKQIIILISSISTIYKILKRLSGFTSKIELDFQRNQIIEKLKGYKILKEQIQYFFYMKISFNFMDFSKISRLIEEFNWAPSPEEGSKQLYEASAWVNVILNIFQIIISELINQLNDIFGEKKLRQFFIILIRFILSKIQNIFSRIKECNDTGRSIMLKDIKFLKQGIENTLKKYNYNKNIPIDDLFDIIFQYVNAWYYNEDELIKFIFDNNINYKNFEGFLSSSFIISKLSPEIKNFFIKKVNQQYLLHFKKVTASLKD